MEEEEKILRYCQRGDANGFSDMVRALEERIFRLAWRMTGDPLLAEEAASLVLYKIWTKAGRWRGEASARTWIYRIAVRTTLDVERGRKRWRRRWKGNMPIAVADRRAGPAELAAESESRRKDEARVQDAISQLAAEDRALIHLFYFEGHAIAEIGDILGVSRDALKMRLSRARQRLKRLLENKDG